jgi:hypothetical protein
VRGLGPPPHSINRPDLPFSAMTPAPSPQKAGFYDHECLLNSFN